MGDGMTSRRWVADRQGQHRFYDYNGDETDFETWMKLRDTVCSDWVPPTEASPERVLVSTIFRGDDADGEIVLWETRSSYPPEGSQIVGQYRTRAEAVKGDREIRTAVRGKERETR